MGYKKSLNDAVSYALSSKCHFGDSRHEGKINGTDTQSIYSYKTYHNYLESCNRFVNYCKDNYSCKTLSDCEKHINDYIQDKRAEGVSAYTQKAYLSAIGKLYGQSYFDKVETDSRHRADITRSRLETESLRQYNELKHQDLKEFCQATGLRRSELEKIKGDCLVEKDGKYYIHVENGKGGKNRDVYILNQNQNVIDKIKNTNDNEKVWGRVNCRAPIHEYRSDYANTLYNQLARDTSTLSYKEVYHCKNDMAGRHFDKLAMREVSDNLGHNRIDVIAQNYLR